jgi:hypothetical protein
MKAVEIVLVAVALTSGITSAYFWWRSGQTSFVLTTWGIITGGGPAITARDLETYLQKVSRLNTFAALAGAISVTASAARWVAAGSV